MFKHHFPHMGFEDAETIANRRSPNEFPHKMVEARRGFSAGGRGKFVCVKSQKLTTSKRVTLHTEKGKQTTTIVSSKNSVFEKKKAESDIGANNGVTMLRR